jgi:hypothetical protein
MPKPVFRSDLMWGSMAEAGGTVKSITDHRKPSALGWRGYSPTVPKVAGKRQTGPAAMDYPFA